MTPWVDGFKLEMQKLAKKKKRKKKPELYPYGMTPPQAAMIPGIGSLVGGIVNGGDEVHSGV